MADYSITLGGKPCSDPRLRFHGTNPELVKNLPLWRRANSFTCPVGKEPGVGYLLLKREYLNQLSKDSRHDLTFNSPNGSITFPDLMIVSSLSMGGMAGDANSPMLVEVRDNRNVLKRGIIEANYNVMMPVPTDSDTVVNRYYTTSLQSGTTVWTWEAMINDILSGSGTISLPFTPSGWPEGFRFNGANQWDAMHAALARLGCTSAYNPVTKAMTFVRREYDQSGLDDAFDAISGRLLQDFDPRTNYTLGNIPAEVYVYFPRREKWRGTEETTTQDSPTSTPKNWEIDQPYYRASGSTSGGEGYVAVAGDMYAIYGNSGFERTTEMQARADEIAATFRAPTPLKRIYSGIVDTIMPGEKISRVTWRNYGDGLGLVTEFENGELYGNEIPTIEIGQGAGGGSMIEAENLLPTDLARHSHPVYPDLLQLVTVVQTGSNGDSESPSAGTFGDSATAGYFHDGIVRLIRGGVAQQSECYIFAVGIGGVVAQEDGDIDVIGGASFLGRLSGTARVSGSEKPLYVIRPSNSITGSSYDSDTGVITFTSANGTVFTSDDIRPDAADIPIADAGGLITATDVEGALAEIASEVDGLGSPAAADITDATADGIALITSADANPFTDAEQTLLSNQSGTNTGDQDISGIATNAGNISTNTAAIALNTAKVTANTANVTAAGALMDSEVTNLSQVKAFDSSDYATAAQGATADSALQNITGENLTDLSDVDTDKSKTPADGDVLTFDGTDWNAETPASVGTANGYLFYQDQKSDGTNGGSSVATTWTARELNTEVADTNGNGSLSSNQITLDAGTYLYRAWAPFLDVQDVRLRLYDATDATAITDGLGDNGGYSAGTSDATSAQIVGRFTIAASKAIELQYYADLVQGGNGLGFHDGLSLGVEKYARIELIKIETSDAQEYILIQDQKSDGTDGGSSTATTWSARELNTEVYDTGNNCSLSSNQFTLDAGTYRYTASAPFLNSQDVRLRLYNVTDTSEVSGSLSDGGGYSASTTDALRVETTGRFTIASAKAFELQYYLDNAQATTGLGFDDGQTLGVEKYSRVELIKEG